MKQCKCEHWQECPTCMPHRFDADGNRKPPEPTPLEAARLQVKALTEALFQAQEAAKSLARRRWVGLSAEDLAEIPPSAYEGAIWADAKLKEKNT